MEIDIFQLPGILRRRFIYLVISTAVFLVLALFYALTLKPVYSSSAELILDPVGLLAESGGSSSPTSAQQDSAGLDSQIYVVQSRTVLDQVVKDLGLTNDPYYLSPAVKQTLPASAAIAAAAGALKQHLTVTRAGDSLILLISVEHRDAQKAAEVANGIANTYLRQIDDSRADAARRASGAFQIQASELRDRVLKAEMAVEKFKSENGLASAGQAGLVIDQQLAGLNAQLITARGVEEQQQTIYQQAKQLTMDAIKSGGIPEALQSQTIELLRDRYVQLIDRQTQLETNLGANHPQLRAIRSQVANMQKALEQELARLRQSMESSYQRAAANTRALQDRLDSLTRSSFDSGAAQIRLRQLESEAEAVQALYKSFLTRAEELGQQQTLKTNNSRIITAATAAGRGSSLVKLVIVAAGGLFGLAAGAGLAVLHELLANLAGASRKQAPQPHRQPPVLAYLPGAAAQAGPSRWSIFRRHKTTANAPSQPLWDEGIRSVADLLSREVSHRLPSSIVFASAHALRQPAANVVPDIVEALVDLGYDIRYAPGALQAEKRRDGAGRPSLVSALDRASEAEGTIFDRLRYQYFTATSRARRAGLRPTFSRYAGASVEIGDTITVINACATQASRDTEALAATADAIILIRDTEFNETLTLLARLEPWSDRLLGQIVVGETDG